MVNTGPQALVVSAPPPPPALQQHVQQAKHIPQIKLVNFKPEFSGNQKNMQKHIYLELMIG